MVGREACPRECPRIPVRPVYDSAMRTLFVLSLTCAIALTAVPDAFSQGAPAGTPSGKQSKPAAKPPTPKPPTPTTKAPPAGKAAAAPKKPTVTADPAEKPKRVYVVPMGVRGKGVFGLDIHAQPYGAVVKDIDEKKPDVVVFILDSADLDSVRYLGDDPRKFGMFDDDSMRALSRDLHEVVDRNGCDAVMIIRDAVGYSALLGLNWSNMYMTESARLAGLSRIKERTEVEDPEVKAKFREAFVGICNGFLIAGGYNPSIGLAMMRDDKMLSATFKGREIVWTEDASGTWVVDGSPERITANFNAELAEELGVSDGTVSDDPATMIDDMMYQRGYRSFERIPEDGAVIVNEYIEGWRKALADIVEAYPKYEEALGDATGANEKKFVQKAKSILESVLAKLKKYPAIEMKLRQEFGITKLEIETEILRLQERLRGLNKSGTAPASGGRQRGGGGIGAGS